MTDSLASLMPQPGWYTDPAWVPRLRWWDGAQWTEHWYDPAQQAYGVASATPVGPATPVYNAFIWMLVGHPLLWTVGTALGPDYLLAQFLNLVFYAGAVALAYADWRALGRAGFVRPFHWAWAFLSSPVYVVGRSVIVHRQAGRGLWPIWLLTAFLMLSIGGVLLSFIVALPLMASIVGF